MTIHHLLPRLPIPLRERIVSLVDVIIANLIGRSERHLLICSSGALQLQVFQRHPDWPQVASLVVFPSESDQQRIHRELIYPIKQNPDLNQFFPLLESLLERYEVNNFVAGCTEVHLLAKRLNPEGGSTKSYRCIDPLILIAQDLASKYQPAEKAMRVVQ
jgi:aspartate racemase